MNKLKILLWGIILIGSLRVIAQPTPPPPPMQQAERPTVYMMADEVRNALGLDQSQFEKVYTAYEKYNKAVFGDEPSDSPFQRPPGDGNGPGRFPSGRPEGGFGAPGGMPGGNPPGGMGGNPPGGMGGNPPQFNGNPSERMNDNNLKKAPTQKEIEKMQKNISKQEEKLEKSIKKILKKQPEKFTEWQKIRERQLFATFPGSPDPNVGK